MNNNSNNNNNNEGKIDYPTVFEANATIMKRKREIAKTPVPLDRTRLDRIRRKL
jgi:hypothetical protein